MSDTVQNKNHRPFTMVYNDFLDYEGLNSKEKLVMIMLMRYGKNAVLSVAKLSKKIRLSERTLRYTLKSLEEKRLISRQARHTTDGGQMSNAYTVTANPEIWKSEVSDDLHGNLSKEDIQDMIEALQAAGYTVQGPTNEKAKTADNASEDISETIHEDTSNTESESSSKIDLKKSSDSQDEKQVSEEYSMDYLHQYFNYDLICSFKNPYGGLNFLENKHDRDILDSVFSVLYDMLNDPNDMIQIGQDSVPLSVVRENLFALTFDAIIAVVDAYNKQVSISNPTDWLKIALYNNSETQFSV